MPDHYNSISVLHVMSPCPVLCTSLQEDAQVTAETAAHALAQLQAAQASLEAEAAAAARRARAATEAEIKAQVRVMLCRHHVQPHQHHARP
jgi:hypothetical protein